MIVGSLFFDFFFFLEKVLSDIGRGSEERLKCIVDVEVGEFIFAGKFFEFLDQIDIGPSVIESLTYAFR